MAEDHREQKIYDVVYGEVDPEGVDHQHLHKIRVMAKGAQEAILKAAPLLDAEDKSTYYVQEVELLVSDFKI